MRKTWCDRAIRNLPVVVASKEEVEQVMADTTLGRFHNVGAIVAAATNGQTHEWDQYHQGVFTHELLSGLRGAADVNEDSAIEYSELGAYLSAANREVPDLRARLKVITSPPRRRSTLADHRAATNPRGCAGPLQRRQTGLFLHRGSSRQSPGRDALGRELPISAVSPAGRAAVLRVGGDDRRVRGAGRATCWTATSWPCATPICGRAARCRRRSGTGCLQRRSAPTTTGGSSTGARRCCRWTFARARSCRRRCRRLRRPRTDSSAVGRQRRSRRRQVWGLWPGRSRSWRCATAAPTTARNCERDAASARQRFERDQTIAFVAAAAALGAVGAGGLILWSQYAAHVAPVPIGSPGSMALGAEVEWKW